MLALARPSKFISSNRYVIILRDYLIDRVYFHLECVPVLRNRSLLMDILLVIWHIILARDS